MNVKHNINYFKKTDNLKYIGAALMIVGFAMLWVGLGWTAYILATVGMPVGIALFFIGTAARSSESDIEDCIKRGTVDMDVRLEEDKHYIKKLIKHIPPQILEGYDYDDGLMFKKLKNGSLMSSVYTKAKLYVLSDSLYVIIRRVHLTEDRQDNEVIEISYDMLEDTEILRDSKKLSFNNKSFTAKLCRFTVTYDGGKVVSLPINDDINADNLPKKIKEVISEYKEKDN